MSNVHSRGVFARLVFVGVAFAPFTAPAMAQTYHDSGGTIPPAVVPLIGCSAAGNCSGPVSSTNPMPVSGTFSASLGGFAPGGSYAAPLAVSTTSARVALPAGVTVVVYNTGSASAYVILGNSSATATTSDDVVPAGGWMAFTVGTSGYLAAITASGTTTLNVSGGSGLPTGAGGGGGGGGGSVPTGSAGSPNAAVLSIQGVSGGLALPVTETGATSAAPATQSISAADAASTAANVANGQVFVTGAPTANSAASFALSGDYDTLRVQVSGTWVGTLNVEMSTDGGATWVAQGVHQTGTTWTTNAFTANFLGESNASGFTNVRVRASAWTSGAATVKIVLSVNPNSVYLANTIKFSDSTTPSITNTIKAGSTAAVAGDTSQVVALSPNSPLPAGSAIIGAVNHAPTSSSAFSISHGVVGSLGNSLVAKAFPGNLYGYNCTAVTGGAAGYCVAVNATSAPSTGAISGVLDACYFPAGAGGCSLSRPNFPANYSNGIVILVTSATSPFTYTTGTDTAFISADYQ